MKNLLMVLLVSFLSFTTLEAIGQTAVSPTPVPTPPTPTVGPAAGSASSGAKGVPTRSGVPKKSIPIDGGLAFFLIAGGIAGASSLKRNKVSK